MSLARIGDDLDFGATYIASKVGATGLTVTVDVYRDGTKIITGASATEDGDGLYTYDLDGATYVTVVGLYVSIFKTADATVDQQHIPHAFTVWPAADAWDTNLDATVSSRSDFDETADPVELLDSGGAAGTSAAELVVDMAVPTAAVVADAVLDELTSEHTTAGSTGAALGRIGTAAITVTGPVDVASNVSVIQGADEDQIDFANTAGTWDDLTSATVTIYVPASQTDGSDFSKAMTVVTPTGSQKVRLALLDTEADLFKPGTHKHQVWATLSGGDEKLLASGAFAVTEDARP